MRGSIDMIQLVFRGLLVLAFLEMSFANTCDERLQHLENRFENLQLRLEDQAFASNGFGNSRQDSINMKLEKENQDLEKIVASLEEALTDSNRQMYLLQARVSELERKTQEQEARLAIVERNSLVSEMKLPIRTRKIQNQLEETDIANGSKDTTDTFENFPSNDDNFTHTIGLIKTKIKRDVPVQGYPPMDDARNVSEEKRLLSGLQTTQTPVPGGVAFSAYVSIYQTEISKDHIIRFDKIVTNIGNHYNSHSGTFTAPQHGVYVFTWNLYSTRDGHIYSQVAVNSNAVSATYTSGEGATNIRTTTGIVVVEVNQGDVVFVRTHPTASHVGYLYSNLDWRSSFNGWKIF